MIQVLSPINPQGADAVSGSLFLYGHTVTWLSATWPAGLAGSLYVEVTDDAGEWSEYPNSSITLSGSSSGYQPWTITGSGHMQARVHFSFSSDTRSAPTPIVVKGIAKGAQ